MKIITRKKFTFYFKEESITITDGFNTTSYNVYLLQNRKPFKKFYETLEKSSDTEYTEWPEIITLAKKYRLISMVGYIPKSDV